MGEAHGRIFAKGTPNIFQIRIHRRQADFHFGGIVRAERQPHRLGARREDNGLRLLTDWNGELQADRLASHIGRNAADELTVA